LTSTASLGLKGSGRSHSPTGSSRSKEATTSQPSPCCRRTRFTPGASSPSTPRQRRHLAMSGTAAGADGCVRVRLAVVGRMASHARSSTARCGPAPSGSFACATLASNWCAPPTVLQTRAYQRLCCRAVHGQRDLPRRNMTVPAGSHFRKLVCANPTTEVCCVERLPARHCHRAEMERVSATLVSRWSVRLQLGSATATLRSNQRLQRPRLWHRFFMR
jgi:hypothetical protein